MPHPARRAPPFHSRTSSHPHRGGASQAAKFRDEWVIGRIAEAASADEARKLAAEHATDATTRPDFLRVNAGEMYRITLAKFAQNPRLGRWLVDTDAGGLMPAIFHTDEGESFWALGPLKKAGAGGREGPAREGYAGRNMNGQVLMCVREVLREHYASEDAQRRARPAVRRPGDLSRSFASYERATKRLRTLQRPDGAGARLPAGLGGLEDPPLAQGSLIDRRYRVLDHRVTAGLGAFAGPYGYVCVDEMPAAEPLEARVRGLVRLSASAGLRGRLERLQEGLCDEALAAVEREWDEVEGQVSARGAGR